MANIKFSEFQDAGPLDPGDEVVGLQSGVNTRFPQSLFKGDPGTPGTDGNDGADGTSATADAGTTTTLAPGSDATVTNAGTPTDAVFNFGIPRGADGTNGTDGIDGDPGAPGLDGNDGADGLAATITVGTTTTLAPGSEATVTNVGTPAEAIFDFGIPEGEQGQSGSGTGDVNGPDTSTTGNVAVWDNVTGDLLADSTKVAANLVTNAGGSTSGNLPILSGTSGKVIVDSGKSASSVVTGPASAVTDNIATYSTTTGKVIKDGGVAIADLGDVSGPDSAVSNHLVAFDGTTGKLIQSTTINATNQVAANALANSALQPGQADNVSELVNDVGYLTTTTGDARYYTETEADGLFATAAQGATADTATQPGDNVSTLTNDAGYLDDATAFASAAQGLLADTATQPGDNVSTLTNDAGYKAYYSGATLPDPAGYDEGDLFCVTS